MIYSQYLRLNVHVAESSRTVIRKAHTRLNPEARTRKHRTARHRWLRSILICHADALAEYHHVTRRGAYQP